MTIGSSVILEIFMETWRSSRRLWLLGGVLLALLLAFGTWLWFPVTVPVQVLKRRELVHSVVATATSQTQHRANAGVQIAGKVLTVQVKEGERFRQGQILLQLDDSEARSALAAAELAVRQAEFKLRQWREVQAPTARASEQQAHANLIQTRAQLTRQQDLFRQGFIGQAALDEAMRTYQVAQAQALTAQAQRQANEDDGVEQSLAQSTLVLARTNAQAANARLSYTRLLAPFDGLVVSRHVEPGDMVQPGKTLLMLAPNGVTELVAQIDERNLSLLRLGQPAMASADAFAQQRFAAVVSAVAPGVDAQRGSVQVKLQVGSPPDYLRQDMTVSVEIEVGRQAAALAVPLEAVHDSESAHPWVWRVTAASRLERAEVTLGLRSGAWVQLLTGVAEGQRVLTTAGNGLREGQRVKPSSP
jgi:HlyD family secretion protein